MSEFVWLRHPETGGSFRCPEGAADVWQQRGWVPCDPPAERDTTKDPVAETAAPVRADEPAPKTSRRQAAATDKEE